MTTDLRSGLDAAFAAVNQRQLAGLDEFLALYDPDVYFEDPLQRTHGLDAFRRAMERMMTSLRDIEFQLEEFSQTGDLAFLSWTMRFKAPLGVAVVVEGTSHLRLRQGKILFHRDYWDLLSSLAETSPALGLAYRSVTKLLA